MPKGKKELEIRARVDESLKRKFKRFYESRGWTESQAVREAAREIMARYQAQPTA